MASKGGKHGIAAGGKAAASQFKGPRSGTLAPKPSLPTPKYPKKVDASHKSFGKH